MARLPLAVTVLRHPHPSMVVVVLAGVLVGVLVVRLLSLRMVAEEEAEGEGGT